MFSSASMENLLNPQTREARVISLEWWQLGFIIIGTIIATGSVLLIAIEVQRGTL